VEYGWARDDVDGTTANGEDLAGSAWERTFLLLDRAATQQEVNRAFTTWSAGDDPPLPDDDASPFAYNAGGRRMAARIRMRASSW
jgi:hypothetical protein